MTRYNATKILIMNVDIKFDKYIVKNFLKIVGHYPKDTNVILSNGYRGIIEKENGFNPIVRLTLTNRGEIINKKETIDLAKNNIEIYDIDYKNK